MAVIVVTDGEQRAALAAVRSLGAAGHTVHVTRVRDAALASSSRWCRGAHRVPDPMHDAAGTAAALATVCRAQRADVLLPIGEATALAVLSAPPAGVQIPLPALETFRRICDKAAVHDAAARVGLRVPRQQVVHAPSDAIVSNAIFPAVLKPSRSIAGADGQRVKEGVRYVADAADYARAVSAVSPAAFPLLLQERVAGEGIGVFHLLWGGREVARFAHRRLREKPPSGGVSTLRESVALPEALHARSLALLQSLGLTHGVAMVEFKGERDSDPAIMEINARLWGSLQLAIDAGVDFPALLVACALGQHPTAVTSWTHGVRSRWFWGDIDHLLLRARRGVDAHGHPVSGAAWQAIREVLLARDPQQREEILRPDDRGPFVRETLDWLARR